MNAQTLLSSRPPRGAESGSVITLPRRPANDELSLRIGSFGGPEQDMAVSFVGLTEAEQARALASFPGGRRCVPAQG